MNPEGGPKKHEGEEVDLTSKVPVENPDGVIESIDPLADTADHVPLEAEYDRLLKIAHRSEEEQKTFEDLSDTLNRWYPGKKKKDSK